MDTEQKTSVKGLDWILLHRYSPWNWNWGGIHFPELLLGFGSWKITFIAIFKYGNEAAVQLSWFSSPVSHGMAWQIAVNTEPLPAPLQVWALDGHVLHSVQHRMKPLLVTIAEYHQERLTFLTPSPHHVWFSLANETTHESQLKQDLETDFWILCAENPLSWSSILVWVEYAHNSHASTSTGLSPFQATYGYQPPLFSSQELEASVLSALALVKRCRSAVWRRVRDTFFKSSRSYTHWASLKRHPAPPYHLGQKVWLSTQDLPLKVACTKLASRFIRPLPISKDINPITVHLNIPRALRIHRTFHVPFIELCAKEQC